MNPLGPSRGTPPAHGAPRILLYSHDSWGLGHLRRSLTLATALTGAFSGASVVIVTGSPCATFFPSSPGVELIKLPSVTKDEAGRYRPRNLPGSLESVLALRRSILRETFRVFAPDLMIVDHQVIGLAGEVLPLLREARSAGTRTILGIRDIIDSPEVVARDWSSADCRWALSEGYDRVCVYGAPEVFDPRVEYPLPEELRERIEFTGYVVRPIGPRSFRPIPASRPQVLVTAGGGEDGVSLIRTYLDGLVRTPSWETVIVAGPLVRARDMRRIKRRASLLERVQVHRFHSDLPRLLEEADAVLGMAGYNTCAEIMASAKPAVYVPRTHPRREQLIRAQRLERRGLGRALEDPAPSQLVGAVHTVLGETVPVSRLPSMRGCAKLAETVGEMLGVSERPESIRVAATGTSASILEL